MKIKAVIKQIREIESKELRKIFKALVSGKIRKSRWKGLYVKVKDDATYNHGGAVKDKIYRFKDKGYSGVLYKPSFRNSSGYRTTIIYSWKSRFNVVDEQGNIIQETTNAVPA